MSTTLYRSAGPGVSSHRFSRATGKVGRPGSSPLNVDGYLLATKASSWLIHRPVSNGIVREEAWSVSHTGTGLAIGYTFDTLNEAKGFVLSLAESTATAATPALDAEPLLSRAPLSAEAMVDLRAVKAVFDAWLAMKHDEAVHPQHPADPIPHTTT